MAPTRTTPVSLNVSVRWETWQPFATIASSRSVPLERILSQAIFGKDDAGLRVKDSTSYAEFGAPKFYSLGIDLPLYRLDELGVAASIAAYDLETYVRDRLEQFVREANGNKTPVRELVRASLRVQSDVLKGLRRRAKEKDVPLFRVIENILDADDSLRQPSG